MDRQQSVGYFVKKPYILLGAERKVKEKFSAEIYCNLCYNERKRERL